jgi:hypothetical protein
MQGFRMMAVFNSSLSTQLKLHASILINIQYWDDLKSAPFGDLMKT